MAKLPIYQLVLFDTVPGGAGNVKRIIYEKEKFKKIIENAINRLSKCNCSSSCYNCLRNYSNQKYHDILNRNETINFLKQFI